MSDGPTTVETLAGAPPSWPATLRDLLRDAANDGADRATLSSKLADGPTVEEGDAERRLAFLERAGVVDCADDRCVPGEHGREYLDTHDEAVLYEALASSADGFEAALEALAVRPLTDVEVADLLSTAVADGVGPEASRAYRAWLEALGYLEREDGVNELTRKGRRLVATTEELTPPGEREPTGTDPFAPGGPRTPRPGHDEDPEGKPGERPDSGRAKTRRPDADRTPTDDGGDDSLERDLRARYDDTCMVCGDGRQRDAGAGYSEVHYLMPLAAPHEGPAAAENAVVVCPNHRADLEHGTVTVDPRTLTVEHAYEPGVSGRTLSTADDHEVGAQYLAYHNDVVADE